MAKRRETGTCRICGNNGELSYEHIPPRKAFNDRPVSVLTGTQYFESRDSDDKPRGKIQQRGLGDYTLCNRCNNDTGSWYGTAYVEWTVQGSRLRDLAPDVDWIYYTFRIHPLRVLKEILCIFFSVMRRTDLIRVREDMVKFVRDKTAKDLNPSVKVFAYLNFGAMFRQTALLSERDAKGNTRVYCEFSYRPFGYIITKNDYPIDSRLVDISYFSRFSYDESKEIPLLLPVLNINSPLPGVFP